MKYRIEKDTLGEVEVPVDVYYGPQTGSDQRIGRVRLEACEAEKQGGVSFIERYAIYERQWRIRLDACV